MHELFDLKYWAGSDESLAAYMLCLRKMVAEFGGDIQAAGAAWGAPATSPADDERVPRLFQRAGEVGIIKVAGPLNNSDSWRNEYYGMTGYPEIREAMVYAAKQQDVGAIVMDVASGGGAVAGVFDTAQLIKTIDTKVKPVYSFSGGGVMSAAYLLASASRALHIDQMAEAGSVGVIAVHQEMSKLMKEIGITATVMRSGKYKGMGNPYEPLSEQAKAEMQAQLDQMYEVFVQHVADMRGVSYAVADEKMAQGRVFIGQRAKEVGLVDAISNFDSLMSKVQGGIDSKRERSKYGANSTNQNNKGITMAGKSALTEQDVAALAEGAGALAGAAPAASNEPAAPAAEQPAAPAAPEAAAPAAAAPAAVEPTALQVVQTQLSEAQAAVTSLTIELRDANAKIKTIEGSHASMRAIAVASVNRLKVALGQTPGGAEAMDDAALLAEHDSLRAAFESKFRAGGVAAVAPADTSDKGAKAAAEDPLRKARIAATRLK
jgi:signal peptide peptidase SppA